MIVDISAVRLERTGDSAVVSIEVEGRWIEVIQEPFDAPYSHIVERSGMQKLVGEAPPLEPLHLDREAYEAYCRHTGWKSLATGADLPQWDSLPEAIRRAWQVSTAWVVGRLLHRHGIMK